MQIYKLYLKNVHSFHNISFHRLGGGGEEVEFLFVFVVIKLVVAIGDIGINRLQGTVFSPEILVNISGLEIAGQGIIGLVKF